MILNRSDISEIASDKTDSFQTQILKDDGSFDQVSFDKKINLKNWQTLFLDIINKNKNEIVIIEDETSVPALFLMGKIELIGKESVSIKSFTGAANWNDESEIIEFDSINTLQIESSYIKGYKRYFDRNPNSWI